MIQMCKKCGTSYNDQTVDHCPACGMTREDRYQKYSKSEVDSFRLGQIKEKKKQVNSFRSNEVIRYERETKRKVY